MDELAFADPISYIVKAHTHYFPCNPIPPAVINKAAHLGIILDDLLLKKYRFLVRYLENLPNDEDHVQQLLKLKNDLEHDLKHDMQPNNLVNVSSKLPNCSIVVDEFVKKSHISLGE